MDFSKKGIAEKGWAALQCLHGWFDSCVEDFISVELKRNKKEPNLLCKDF